MTNTVRGGILTVTRIRRKPIWIGKFPDAGGKYVTVALILKYLDEEYQTSIWHGVACEAGKLGVNLVCVQGEAFDGEFQAKSGIFSLAFAVPLDGILVLTSLFTDHQGPDLSAILKDSLPDVPVVSIGVALDGFPSLVVDAERALRALVSHLAEDHGYRRFLYLGGPAANGDNAAREAVLRGELSRPDRAALGCSLDAMNGDLFSEVEGKRLVAACAKKSPGAAPDAILAGSDDMAMGILKYLRRSADRAWRDCPVTGIDDIPLAGTATFALTTVSQPLEELGRRALATVVRMIRGEPVAMLTEIHASFVPRNSCGCTRFAPDFSGVSGDLEVFREQQLADSSRLGQELMAAQDIESINRPLTDFLSVMGTRSFSLIVFPSPGVSVSETGTLAYTFLAEPSISSLGASRTVVLADFIASALSRANRGSHENTDLPFKASCVLIRSGVECLGMALYETEESSHPFMSGCCAYLAHTLKRLETLERERERARDLEAEVARRTAQLEAESRRRMEVEEEVLRISDLERLRFSVDLHDDICQRLAAMTMVCKNFSDRDPAMGLLLDMATGTLQRTRRYAHDSFPFELDSMDLTESLRQLCAELDGTAGCALSFSCDERIDELFSRDQKIDLFRIAKEAINNALCHAKARSCAVSLEIGECSVVLRVSDDGTGDSGLSGLVVKEEPARRPRGLGMRSMEYRSHRLGAAFTALSSPGVGTTIEVRISNGGTGI